MRILTDQCCCYPEIREFPTTVCASIPTQLVFSLNRAAGLLPHIPCASSAVHLQTSSATQQPTGGSIPRNKCQKLFLNYFANYPNVRIIPHPKHLRWKCSVEQLDWLTDWLISWSRIHYSEATHCITVFTKAPTDPYSEPEDPLLPSLHSSLRISWTLENRRKWKRDQKTSLAFTICNDHRCQLCFVCNSQRSCQLRFVCSNQRLSVVVICNNQRPCQLCLSLITNDHISCFSLITNEHISCVYL
jgi:hypothetical protein